MIRKFQVKLPDSSQKGTLKMSDDLVRELQDVDVTWVTSEGVAVISTEKSLGEIKRCIRVCGLIPQEMTHTEFGHRVNKDGIEPPHTNLRKNELT